MTRRRAAPGKAAIAIGSGAAPGASEAKYSLCTLNSSSRPPGVARVTNRHGSDEALAIVCGTPRGIHSSPPAPSVPQRSPSWYASSPYTTMTTSSSSSCTWSGGPPPCITPAMMLTVPRDCSAPTSTRSSSPPISSTSSALPALNAYPSVQGNDTRLIRERRLFFCSLLELHRAPAASTRGRRTRASASMWRRVADRLDDAGTNPTNRPREPERKLSHAICLRFVTARRIAGR